MRASVWLLVSVSAILTAACSADPNAGPLLAAGGGSGIAVSDGGDGGFETCAGTISMAVPHPLDLLIMLDRSGSMLFHINQSSKLTKWQAVTQAIGAFVEQPNLANVSIGLQYFAQWLPGPVISCNPDDYANAAVPMAPLPDNAQALIDSMSLQQPSDGTPTAPALKGALTLASRWATDHPGHVVATILATDGMPAGCGAEDDIQRVADIARSGYTATPNIRTYAIGIGSGEDEVAQPPDAGRWSDNLNFIAAAGGTTQAFVVQGNVVTLFVRALNRIRGAALGCSFLLPDAMGQPVDTHLVNVLYTKGETALPAYVPKVPSSSDCGASDGWYYDDEHAPTSIVSCPATCDKLSDDLGAKVEIQVGCRTVPR